jgi:hypothetical protein
MLQENLNELQETWDFTEEELRHIKGVIINISLGAVMDSAVREEILKESEEFTEYN